MNTICAIYLRISLDRTGEQLAIDRQREDCIGLAEHRGWKIHQEYVDNSISASDARKARPAYDALVRDFEAGLFDALVCWDLDRLTRQPRQLEDWIDAATDRGLRIVTANGEADLGTDGGRMFARIKASVARAEIERKSARQVRALRQRAENGRLPAGVRLTGYDDAGEVNETEAAVVREVFDRFLAGDSLRALATALEERGIPTRSGRAWHPSSVRTVLLNPRYAGWSVYRGSIVEKDGERVRGGWEPIVTEGTFDAVQRRLTDPDRVSNRVGTDRKHLGSGLYLCGTCGKPVRSHSDRYRCGEGHVIRSRGQVDGYVLAVVRERLSRPDLANLLHRGDTDEERSLTQEVDELRRRLAAIEHDYDDGLIDGRRYGEASKKIRTRLDRAQGRRAELATGAAAGRVLGAPDPVAAFGDATLGAQRTTIAALADVSLFPGTRGSRILDPETIRIDWKGAS